MTDAVLKFEEVTAMSYTRKYISLTDVGTKFLVGL
jgi:hypothetical protein